MQAIGRNQSLLEPRTGGCGLWRVRNRKWTPPANRPLAFEPSPNKAQTHQLAGGPVPKGLHPDPLTFRRRSMALKKWLRLYRDHTPQVPGSKDLRIVHTSFSLGL